MEVKVVQKVEDDVYFIICPRQLIISHITS